jgi:HTH-type transcriptional regulator / antitoxin HigA
MKPRILKSEQDYEEALKYLETLMDQSDGSQWQEDIALFAHLIEDYEDQHFPIKLPDPIEAVKFALDQQGLTRKDLIPLLGSKGKVSEVLNRKRPLSISMIRALHTELGIPAEILLQDPLKHVVEAKRFDHRNFPFSEMCAKEYFPGYTSVRLAKEKSEELLGNLFCVFDEHYPQVIHCRQSNGGKEVDNGALLAWQAHILHTLKAIEHNEVCPQPLDDAFYEQLLTLSSYTRGPLLVGDLLATRNIHFVIMPHLSRTYLDGAAFLSPQGNPIIAMTLRYDRSDNFWFTLMHELAHVVLHLGADRTKSFFDDTSGLTIGVRNEFERQADEFAQSKLIPESYLSHRDLQDPSRWTEQRIISEAKRMNRGPAVLVGRLRWESGDYTLFTNLLGKVEY